MHTTPERAGRGMAQAKPCVFLRERQGLRTGRESWACRDDAEAQPAAAAAQQRDYMHAAARGQHPSMLSLAISLLQILHCCCSCSQVAGSPLTAAAPASSCRSSMSARNCAAVLLQVASKMAAARPATPTSMSKGVCVLQGRESQVKASSRTVTSVQAQQETGVLVMQLPEQPNKLQQPKPVATKLASALVQSTSPSHTCC